ncbi:GNAT family N-acetyltransferase [Flocculibacter collagenilyticus]|uniref:GNAT family N-acetyltransferase n=1 Tax=Flocculibacter collagenilyticus TaxID=2744479 RepID=UPI0018F46C9A|nr:GNAT family N-acetyltransferase [Flocculibacter collagenilyticus]
MIFRRAKLHDIAEMSAIRLAVKENVLINHDRVTPQMYEDYLEKLGAGWVCELEGKVVGFSYADKVESAIWALFVLPEYEGRGIGKQLINLAAEWLFQLGKEAINLWTEPNTRADAFYKTQGWHRGSVNDDGDVKYTLTHPCGQNIS